MNLEVAQMVAARIWCDPDYEHVEMNTRLADYIARLLLQEALEQDIKVLEESLRNVTAKED